MANAITPGTRSILHFSFYILHLNYMEIINTFKQVKAASKELALITDEKRNDILRAVADAIAENKDVLLEANAKDLARMDKANPLYDRLQLTDKRLADIASDMRHVATLPSPLGRVLKHKVLDNGLDLKRVSVPFGVLGGSGVVPPPPPPRRPW